jgi:transcriptional regulator NrdR family protein
MESELVCPFCGHPKTWANGHHRGQKRLPRRLCPKCRRSFTTGGPIIGHRPPIGERPMTRAEIQRRYRERLKQRQQAAATE